MKTSHILMILAAFSALVSATRADSLAMRSGDHLTGTIVTSNAKDLTLKTDYAGEIKISWVAVREVSSDKALYVVASGEKTVNGTITSEGKNLIVHTAGSGEVRVPLAQVVVVRSADQQAVYEKSLHPSLMEGWKGGSDFGLRPCARKQRYHQSEHRIHCGSQNPHGRADHL